MKAPYQAIHISNLVSYVSLLSSLAAILILIRPQMTPAEYPIVGVLFCIAALADFFDGKFARLFSRESSLQKFGGELDSLIDVISFGVTPFVFLSRLTIDQSASLPMAFLFGGVFVLSIVTRLGFYNSHPQNSQLFLGLPAPLTHLFWLVATAWPEHFTWPWIGVGCVTLSALHLAPFSIPRPPNRVLLIVAGLILFLGLMNFWRWMR